MEPTPRAGAWSAWAGWAPVPRDLLEGRRVRLTVHELADVRALADLRRDWARLPPQVALYTPKQIRHLIRLENALGRVPTAAPDHWRRPDPESYWRVHDFLANVRLERPPAGAGAGAGLGAGVGAGAEGLARGGRWEGAAWGWAAGAVLLAALVLLVRALERFLHKKLFKGRSRSEEWPTPNVLATSHRYGDELPPRAEEPGAFPEAAADPPPPYSQCAAAAPHAFHPHKPPAPEDPPPPYAACYFSNPKDGVPTIHFSRRSTDNAEVGQSSAEINEPVSSSTRSQEDNKISDVGCERNVNSESDASSNEASVSIINNAISEVPNTEREPDETVRIRNGVADHVVAIGEPGFSEERVVAV